MAGEDPIYLVRVRGLPCARCRARPYSSAHHPRQWVETGEDKRRAHDRMAIPLCWECHDGLHRLAGLFRDWDAEDVQLFENLAIIDTALTLEGRGTPAWA